MTDNLRDRIAAAPSIEIPFCYRVADALIAAGVTMPAPRCPEWVRFGGKRINCQGSVGHEGECW